MGLFSIIIFNIRLLTFAKLVKFLKSSAIKAGLNAFSYFPVLRFAKLCQEYMHRF